MHSAHKMFSMFLYCAKTKPVALYIYILSWIVHTAHYGKCLHAHI